MVSSIPLINTQFVCIIDVGNVELAAVISSYLFKPNYYLPLFEFPSVTAKHYRPQDEIIDENTLSVNRAKNFATYCNNALVRLGKCENLILAGLSKEQKSYLDFTKYFNFIEIDSTREVDFFLSPFLNESKDFVCCKEAELLKGLFLAQKKNLLLKLDNNAENINLEVTNNSGLVVVETETYLGSVIAINYASSLNADICVVEKLDVDEEFDIQNYIEEWQKGDEDYYKKIEEIVFVRLGELPLLDRPFVTFFTSGIPYSLVLKNFVPCSYVHLLWQPDFFVLNSLLYERKNNFGAAIVFSPQFFKDEEVNFVSSVLSKTNYYLKTLYGRIASVYNLDMHLKEFPYDIFHICSHGGEIEGHTIEESFVDRSGVIHTVEYDEVLSISKSRRKELFTVQRKTYFKKFDGLVWRSKELKSKNYPHYIFADMQNAMHGSKADAKRILSLRKAIPKSCAIQCSDSTHQGMLYELASHSSPFVFNNTCWSWYFIAEHFLSSGTKGYIGTLWDVNNIAAVKFATSFYTNLFSNTILESFYKAQNCLKGTKSDNIYVYWGLHFTTLNPPISKVESRANVFRQLLLSLHRWKTKLSVTRLKTSADSITDYIVWIIQELSTYFSREDFKNLQNSSKKRSNQNSN